MKQTQQQPVQEKQTWIRPAVEWEEAYEPVAFAVSCAQQPFACPSGAKD